MKFQKVDTQSYTVKLKTALYRHLIDNHPIHEKLNSISNFDLKSLHQHLKLKPVSNGSMVRIKKLIAHWFFLKFEENPMTNLEKVLIEKGINVVSNQQGKQQKQKGTKQKDSATTQCSIARNSKKSKTTTLMSILEVSIE